MGKIKIQKKPPRIDMTPMVDLFFLLLIFFILTARFRVPEIVAIDTPNSVSETTFDADHVMTITIDKDNRVFFNVDNGRDTAEHLRGNILRAMAFQYQMRFTPEEVKKFEGLNAFSLPMSKLKAFINAENTEERDAMHTGIPMDSVDNQLLYWVRFSRQYYNDLIVNLKGDKDADYEKVKKVIEILQGNNINKFSLTTTLEEVDISLENI